jgi:hypothetical protein
LCFFLPCFGVELPLPLLFLSKSSDARAFYAPLQATLAAAVSSIVSHKGKNFF